MICKIFMAPEGAPAAGGTPPPGTPPPAAPAAAAATAAPAAAAAAAAAAPPAAPPAPPAAPPAPEEIKLAFPEGFAVEQAIVDKFLPLAKEAKLSSKQAQAIADLHVEGQKLAERKHVEQVVKWAEESKSDPEIGGVNFDANVSLAKKVIDRIAPQGFKDIITKSGLGNHKDVIKMFSQIGKLITEERLPGGGTGGSGGAESREDALKAAYPNSPEMWGAKQ